MARRKPRILAVLLLVNLALLALPLGGLWMLRLYESALVRQTETELISQAAIIAAAHATVRPGRRTSHRQSALNEGWVGVCVGG